MSEINLTQSASTLGRAIESGQVDPRELTESYLAAAESHQYRDRIFTMLTPKRARAEADAAAKRAKSGLRRSPLDGVPVSWKDLIDTAGHPTEAGSLLLKGRIPDTDAIVLQNAARAGLVMLGKTHMTELAFSGLGINPITATPPNFNDPVLAPGGSSSGAATSVAFGLAAAAIGSDTGGSVRVPAAWNNLVGLKTTHGWLSLQGVVPLIPSFDTVGPLTRSVEDAAILTAILAGEPTPDLTPQTLKGRHFVVANTLFFDDIRPEPLAAFNSFVARLQSAGAKITYADYPEIAEASTLTPALFAPESWAKWRDIIQANPQKMFSVIYDRFRGGANFNAADHIAAKIRLNEIRQSFWAATRAIDAVLMPTSAILPPNAERLLADLDFFASENLLGLRNTRIANLLGGCALTLPTQTPACGITLMAAPGQDIALSRLGISLEAALTN